MNKLIVAIPADEIIFSATPEYTEDIDNGYYYACQYKGIDYGKWTDYLKEKYGNIKKMARFEPFLILPGLYVGVSKKLPDDMSLEDIKNFKDRWEVFGAEDFDITKCEKLILDVMNVFVKFDNMNVAKSALRKCDIETSCSVYRKFDDYKSIYVITKASNYNILLEYCSEALSADDFYNAFKNKELIDISEKFLDYCKSEL